MFNMRTPIAVPGWFQQWLPLVGLFVRDQIVKETASLQRRLEELEQRMEELKGWDYVGTFETGLEYCKGNFCTHRGSLWRAQCDTVTPPGTDATWKLVVKKGRDAERPRMPTKGGARAETVQMRRT